MKKPFAALLMGPKKPSKMEPEEEMDSEEDYEEEDEAGLNVAAEELVDAVKSGDAEGVKMALKSFIEQC